MEKQPIQIISSENHKFKIQNLDGLRKILEADELKDRDLVVVSISGALRQGKSFLLNFFLRYLNAQYKKHNVKDWIGRNKSDKTVDGFEWRGGKERNTIGIWIWSEVFIHDFSRDDKVAIILMDTQGIFDNKTSLKECKSIFAISMLLSSVQCYNVMRQVQENDLTNLQLFTEYAQFAMEADEEPFQKLLFIVRDWPSLCDHEYGPSKEYVKDLLAENDSQETEMHVLRDAIRSSFSDIDSFLMPYPGKDVAVQKSNAPKSVNMDPEFVDCVEKLTESLFAPDNLIRKKVGGEKIQATGFLTYLVQYIKVFSGKELPNPKTVLQSTIEVQLIAIYKECMEKYGKEIDSELEKADVCFEDEELQQKHKTALGNVMSLVETKKMLGGKSILKNKLEKSLKKRYEKIFEMNKTEREKVNLKKNITLGSITAGLGVVAAAASILVTGPIGLFAIGAAVCSTATGAAAGGGIGAAIKAWSPRNWFSKKDAVKEQVKESQKDETDRDTFENLELA